MRDGTLIPDPKFRFQEKTVHRSIRFANSRHDGDEVSKKWMIDQYRMLKVLPPRTPYFIDDIGRVFARRRNRVIDNEVVWAAASPKTLVTSWRRMESVLRTIIRDSMEPPQQVLRRVPHPTIVERRLKVVFPVEGWSRSIINGLAVDQTTQSFVPPTIDAFVAYAGSLLSRMPWRTRLGSCVQCGRFFMNSLNKRGRPRKVCSHACNERRGDPSAWKRSASYRDRQRRAKRR